jgi:hypothetical protein
MNYIVLEYPTGTDLSAFTPGKMPITVSDGAVTVEKGKVSTTFTIQDPPAPVIQPHKHTVTGVTVDPEVPE